MVNTCPCCGAPVRADAWENALAVLSPKERLIAEIVGRRPGIQMRDVADLVYADDPDGGPAWAESSLKSLTSRANRKLAPFGFKVSAGMGKRGGYRVSRIGGA